MFLSLLVFFRQAEIFESTNLWGWESMAAHSFSTILAKNESLTLTGPGVVKVATDQSVVLKTLAVAKIQASSAALPTMAAVKVGILSALVPAAGLVCVVASLSFLVMAANEMASTKNERHRKTRIVSLSPPHG